MIKSAISADSHIVEPPGTYVDRIDRKYKDIAPRMLRDEKLGDYFTVHGMDGVKITLGLMAAAGKSAEELGRGGHKFEDLYRGGWDPEARMADQDRDGVVAEVIYPTTGMMLCNHRDLDYKKACFDAYNLWLAEFCDAHPDRLLGQGQTAMRTPEEGIEELRKAKSLGFRGVMMPGNPGYKDYDDRAYDEFYEAAVEMKMPLSFHILTSKSDNIASPQRGPKINGFLAIIRGCQDIMGTMIFGGVFERHPKLKVVCVEADAGWVPRFMYRMDHAYKRHRYWLPPSGQLNKLHSEYFRENVYTTFQDDWVAFQMKDMCNIKRLLWANDFPHSDSTWPDSQALLKEHRAGLTDAEFNLIVHDNVAELYGLN